MRINSHKAGVGKIELIKQTLSGGKRKNLYAFQGCELKVTFISALTDFILSCQF